MKDLLGEHQALGEVRHGTRDKTDCPWDVDGEWPSGPGEHIPVSRLMDAVTNKRGKGCPSVTAVLLSSGQDAAPLILQLYALQSPQCSPWKIPLLRVLSSHTRRLHLGCEEAVDLTYFVYASRLLFEMVADDSIKLITRLLTPPAAVVPAVPLASRGPEALGRSPALGPASSDFSLAGLLRRAECKGYGYALGENGLLQPPNVEPVPGLSVSLMEFQASTVKWMIDAERDPVGINGHLWEKRDWADGGSFYYLPLAGEFRLQKPPCTTGGLCCEEMGLGKTVEAIALMLANPMAQEELQNAVDTVERHPRVAATLIVAPSSLVGQWENEIRLHTTEGALPIAQLVSGGQVLHYECFGDLRPWGKGRWEDGQYLYESDTFLKYFGPDPRTAGYSTWYSIREMNVAAHELGLAGKPSKLQFSKLPLEEMIELASKVVAARQLGRRISLGEAFPGLSTLRVQLARTVPETRGQRAFYEWPAVFDHFEGGAIITTYSMVHSRAFHTVQWHRVILDECQEVRSSVTIVAKSVAGIKSSHRWMISGTPFHSSLDDLHGELNFLHVWPFSLANDGFWERRVSEPFKQKDRASLPLLHALVDCTVMRHSKNQRYVNSGDPLVRLPPWTIEWQEVHVEATSSELYVYLYLELLCQRVCEGIAAGGAVARREHVRLLSLVSMLQKVVSHPGTGRLGVLDTLKRSLAVESWPEGLNTGSGLGVDGGEAGAPRDEIRFTRYPAEQVLLRLQQQGVSRVGGLLRDTGRIFAVGGEEERCMREELEEKSVRELHEHMQTHSLPIPKVWLKVGVRGRIHFPAACLHLEEANAGQQYFQPQDILRLGTAHMEQTEREVTQVLGPVVHVNRTWSSESNVLPVEPKEGYEIYKLCAAARKKPYIDLIMASRTSSGDVNHSGFESILKVMAGEDTVQCSICLGCVVCPVVTMCAHLFCSACLGHEFNIAALQRTQVKCPLCRRGLDVSQVMEMAVLPQVEEDGQERDASSAGVKHAPPDNASDYGGKAGEEGGGPSGASHKTRDVPEEECEGLVQRLEKFPLPPRHLIVRDHRYPSLDDIFLGHYANSARDISSAKLAALIADVRRLRSQEPSAKFVVFSAHSDLLDKVEGLLTAEALVVRRVDGHVAASQRQTAVSSFNSDPHVSAILLTTGSGASGVTLTAAHTLYLLDVLKSGTDEAQALSRVHRIGQVKSVRCVIFYRADSVESRMMSMRSEHGDLNTTVDAGALTGVNEGGGHFSDLKAIHRLLDLPPPI
jgi:hypothetical protein